MTQLLAGLLLLIVFAVCAGMSYWTGREAIRAIRKWTAGRDQPLISLDPTIADGIPAHWPLNSVRWPQPFVDGRRALSRELCALYAHEAWRKYNRARAASELALVIGGAWLGITLPKTIKTLFTADGGFVLGIIPGVMGDPEWWVVMGAPAVVWLGLSLQSEAEGIALVRAAYAEAVDWDEEESTGSPQEGLELHDQPRGFGASIRRRLRDSVRLVRELLVH
ncbi:hypothetical protein ACIBG5_10780 [Kribbella sp. NPDC050241]|uniref:hypothetical protein n=1 Tax=Kribbella sp. NPDC050241 TaxID=3364115 RepID=UPI00379B9EE4